MTTTYVAKSKEDFVRTIREVIYERHILFRRDPAMVERVIRRDAKRALWCDPLARSGRAAICHIKWGGYKYRLHANTNKLVLDTFLSEVTFKGNDLDGISPTTSTGFRVDIKGRPFVRPNLYLYREVCP
jgi:hypothetical protein